MSWHQWSLGNVHNVNAAPTALPVLGQAAATVLPPNAQYTPEQWTQLQQQNWQQWAQWQQQYQQWQQQYGAEFQKSLTAMNTQTQTAATMPLQQLMPNTSVPPPLPNQPAESKPPPPLDDPPQNTWQGGAKPLTLTNYSSVPPNQPNNYNTAKEQPPGNWNRNQPNWQSQNQNQNQNSQWNQRNFAGNKASFIASKKTPEKPELSNKRPAIAIEMLDNKRNKVEAPAGNQLPPKDKDKVLDPKPVPSPAIAPVTTTTGTEENISEAEKKFIKQFADWESQFSAWKKQNENHPNKALYCEYEKKWEVWRCQLLERREQMRKKRLMKTGSGDALVTKANPNEPPTTPNLNMDASFPSFSKPPPHMANLPDTKGPQTIVVEKPKIETLEPNFLMSSSSKNEIPGLDLVKGDHSKENKEEQDKSKKPEMDAISKGIVTILSDQKIMNMLSLVSQNQQLNLTKSVDTVTTVSLPNPPVVADNISAQNADDSGNGPPDNFSNLDEQTRTSFGGQYDRDYDYHDDLNRADPNNYDDNQYSDGYNQGDSNNYDYYDRNSNNGNNYNRPDGFGANKPFAQGNNRNFEPSGRKPDNFYNEPPPFDSASNVDRPFDNHDKNVDNSSRGIDNLNRGVDNMNRGAGNMNRGMNNMNRGMSMDRGADVNPEMEMNRGMNMNRGLNPHQAQNFGNNRETGNFNREPGNLNRDPSNFNRDSNNFNRNSNNFNRDANNFNREPNTFSRDASNFNRDANNFNRDGNNFNKDTNNFNNRDGNNFNRDPKNFNNFNRDPNILNREPGNFHRDPESFNRDSGNFKGAPDNFKRGPDHFNRDYGDFNREPGNFDREPGNFGREPGNFNRDAGNSNDFTRDRGNFNREPGNFNKDPGNFNREPGNFNKDPGNFNRDSGNFNRDSGNFNRDPGNFNKDPGNFNRDSANFNRDFDNFNRSNDGFNDDFYQGPDNFNRNNFTNDNFAGADNFSQKDSASFDKYSDTASNNDRRFDDGRQVGNNNHRFPEDKAAFGSEIDSYSIDKRSVASLDNSREETAKMLLEEMWKPTEVTDYDHKPPKADDFEIIIETIYMFDYHHKPVNRIPYPERPQWLSNILSRFREFEPQIKRVIERFPERYDRRPPVPAHENYRRYYPEERYSKFPRDRPYPEPMREATRYPEMSRFPDPGARLDEPFEKKYSKKPFGFERRTDEGFNRRPFNPRNSDVNSGKSYERIDDFVGEKPYKELEVRPETELFPSTSSKSAFALRASEIEKKNATLIEDILNQPGRFNRPPRIVIMLRGPPGSGKTSLAKSIKDKEVENGGSPPRILSLDDYFMVEQEKEVEEDGKMVTAKEMVYEYEEAMEGSYRMSLLKSFKKTITDGYFPFIIVDNVNDKVKYFNEMWSFAKQNGFQVYVCEMELDIQMCTKRNIHGRSEAEVEKCIIGWEPTPSHYSLLDATSLIQSSSINEVEMEEINSPPQNESDSDENEDQVRSKWDNFDCSLDNLAKLDGTSKPLRPSRTMEDYLQTDDDWFTKDIIPGKKRVRWADLEERKEQDKMRAIGFVVGQTNWNRMMDPTHGGSALTQTKYIERVRKY